MKLQDAIRDVYGIRLPKPPGDGVFRRFRIDQFRVGFVVSVGDCAVFGCRADGVGFCWSSAREGLDRIELRTRETKDIRFERMVIECAKGLVESGSSLSAADAERLEIAVNRLDELFF